MLTNEPEYGIIGANFYDIEGTVDMYENRIYKKDIMQVESFIELYRCSNRHLKQPPLLIFLKDLEGKHYLRSYFSYETLYSDFHNFLEKMEYIGIARFSDLR